LEGEKVPFCDECGARIGANVWRFVWKFAPILIIRFHRFEEGSDGRFRKNNALISYPMEIDAAEFQKDPESSFGKYYLIAVVGHSGTISNGHYNCVVKDVVNDSKWYNISDSDVSVVSISDARPPEAYLLFYERE
jgi:ubiquitin carboxyl-terminal hydrolase 8